MIQPRLHTVAGSRAFIRLRVPFSVPIMKIAGENRSLLSNEWVIRRREGNTKGLSKRCFRGR